MRKLVAESQIWGLIVPTVSLRQELTIQTL